MDTVILGRGIKCKCGVVFADLMGMSVKVRQSTMGRTISLDYNLTE